jgi:CheY-like chemotaxis protein/glycine cleavage system H lipoate-binding protein
LNDERTLSVLAVDDEQIVLDSVLKHLRKSNYNLHTALSVKDALALMQTTEVDIVLTDLMMPEVDGLEFLKMMKERSPQTPVIMITGYATINTALQATNLGAFDYVAKPFTKSELTSVVARAAELVLASSDKAPEETARAASDTASGSVGEYGWQRLEDDGTVMLGVKQSFLDAVGKIQNIFLPVRGDELRQGSVYVRIFGSDLRSHTVLSPLSGQVVEVNESIQPAADGQVELSDSQWLIRLQPSKFEFEMGELGL